jgi:hypothetical protein
VLRKFNTWLWAVVVVEVRLAEVAVQGVIAQLQACLLPLEQLTQLRLALVVMDHLQAQQVQMPLAPMEQILFLME